MGQHLRGNMACNVLVKQNVAASAVVLGLLWKVDKFHVNVVNSRIQK